MGVALYEIYVNGVKTYSTTQTSFNINGLPARQQYSIYVKAKDVSGNYSPQSIQIYAVTVLQGLQYNYYEGSWTALPNFNTLTPLKKGVSANTDISVRKSEKQYGFLWQGDIKIPVAGTYKFETYSDDGSKLWLSTYDASSTPLVNNDSIHTAPKYASGTKTLEAGFYPISIGYFDKSGAHVMQVYWTCSALFGDNNRHLIDSQYFKDTYTSAGTAPSAPTNLTAATFSYNQIKLTWTDNSTTE